MFKVYQPSDHLLEAMKSKMGGEFDLSNFQELPKNPTKAAAELTSKATGGSSSDVFGGMGSHPIGVPYNYRSAPSSSTSALGAATAGDGGIGAGLGSGLLTGT